MVFIIAAALIAAFFNAAAGVLQRRAAGHVEAHELFRKALSIKLTRHRLWLAGIVLETGAFVLQAAALRHGSLVLVEPLLVTDLVFLLLLLHFRFNIKPGVREWLAVGCICAGLSALLAAANPRGGHLQFSGLAWALMSGSITIVIAIGAFAMRRLHSSVQRAATGGIAAAMSFALVAALTKLTMQKLAASGLGSVFSGWELYALAVAGILSLIVMQNAYAAGPLVVSQPIMEIMDPLVTAIIGILVFGDIISTSAGALAIEVLGALLAATGIVLMGSSKRIQQFAV
jgi:drug/metabolite transporter (DMT)-like permease